MQEHEHEIGWDLTVLHDPTYIGFMNATESRYPGEGTKRLLDRAEPEHSEYPDATSCRSDF